MLYHWPACTWLEFSVGETNTINLKKLIGELDRPDILLSCDVRTQSIRRLPNFCLRNCNTMRTKLMLKS